ncbi:hypothetical protein B484DRAFT_407285 [Ochromonadaceae sp. CCMP2298]|nr:hypothetical protein B484DRAFT_407285 [Ochromonadaceae sp. CCMP2298]
MELVDFRKVVIAAMVKKKIPIDSIKGMLFAAKTKSSVMMVEICSSPLLHNKWSGWKKDNFILHVGIGGQHADFIEDGSLPTSVNSDAYFNDLKQPPASSSEGEGKSGRAASLVDADTRTALRNLLESMFFREESDMWQGFTKHHFGLMHKHLYELAQKGKLEESGLVTDWENGVFPLALRAARWAEACTPPDDKGEIPTADLCATRKKRAAGVPDAQTSTADRQSEEMLAQMRRGNNLAEINILQRAGTSIGGSSSSAPMITPSQASQGRPQSLLEQSFQSLLGKRKMLADAGQTKDDAAMKIVDEQLTKVLLLMGDGPAEGKEGGV